MLNSLLVTGLAENTGCHPRGLGQPSYPAMDPCALAAQFLPSESHTEDYLPVTSCREPSDVFCCCFWHSCSLLPRLFSAFRRFDCPPAWEQKPGRLILGYGSSRGISAASHWGLPSLAATPRHTQSVCSSFLLSSERHRCQCLASAIAEHTNTPKDTLRTTALP